MALKYRPEIDGLRAIAVSAVVLYHAKLTVGGLDLFPGGFIGVDIFLVISGYLITLIILREQSEARFTFANFYLRRARRILPALFVVMAASLAVAWQLMLPEPMTDFAGSGLSALLFGSNFWFWLEDSYTAVESALKPFLHTWTLSLEEQFYILFPIAALFTLRFFKTKLLGILILGLVLSLLLAQYASTAFPDAAFYLLPMRAWELLAGSVVAKIVIDHGREPGPVARAVLPPLGLMLLLHAIFYFHDDMQHPSYMTALPILGTAMIIWAGGKGELVTSILSTRVMVGFGLISYSLYLWHFPVFAFAHIRLEELSTMMSIALIAVSVVFGVAAYFLVEKTTRRPNVLGNKTFVAGMLIAFAALIGAYGYVFLSHGAPQRLGAFVGVLENLRVAVTEVDGVTCKSESGLRVCERRVEAPAGRLVIVGDSHADALSPAFAELARENNYDFIRLSAAGCPFLVGMHTTVEGKRVKENCSPQKNAKVQKYLHNLPPSTVIMSMNLPYYLSGESYDNREGGNTQPGRAIVLTPNKKGAGLADATRRSLDLTAKDVVEAGHKLVLVYPIPEAGWDMPELVSKKLSAVPISRKDEAFETLDITTSYQVFRRRRAESKAMLDAIGSSPMITRVFPDRSLCSNETQRCKTIADGRILYFDSNHLSLTGARMVANQTGEQLGLQPVALDGPL